MSINFKKILSVSVLASTLLTTHLLADFHVMINGQQKGPFSIEQIKKMSKDGSITSNSLVWQAGMANWAKAGAQSELQTIFSAPPPPPPPSSSATPPPPPSIGTSPTTVESKVETEDENQNDLSSAEALANQKPPTLNDWKKDFEEKFNVTIGMAEDGKTFFFGEATVRVSPLDPAYAKELSLSYDKAMLNLQSNFIMQTYGSMTAKTISDYMEDDSTNAKEFDPIKLKETAAKGQTQIIIDKFADVIENKLDSILIKQGVPISEIGKRTIEQKKLLFKDNFSKTMTKKAFASMSGLVPIQTKILTTDRDGKKSVKIGIIAVMSEKTIQFAKDIAKRRTTHVHGKPSSLRKILPKKEKGYLNEIGLRYVYDKKGRPMLLSYGRWSVVGKTSNPARYERKIESAKEKARMFAESYIGEFMKSNINAASGSTVESINEEVAKKITTINNHAIANESENTDEIGETLDKSFKKLQRSSKFKLRGTSQITTWEAKDENGILHVGSVVAWTYAQLENANQIVQTQKSKKKVDKKKKRVAKNISKESTVVNTMDDF